MNELTDKNLTGAVKRNVENMNPPLDGSPHYEIRQLRHQLECQKNEYRDWRKLYDMRFDLSQVQDALHFLGKLNNGQMRLMKQMEPERFRRILKRLNEASAWEPPSDNAGEAGHQKSQAGSGPETKNEKL